MYCPKCGNAKQEPESYCRNCGEFLMDYSGLSYVINKFLGGSRPTTQINVNLAINLITIFTSFLLVGFLNGYYDALKERTGELAPPVINLVYIFLIVISLWQILSLIVGVRLRSKLNRKKVDSELGGSEKLPNSLSSKNTQELLASSDSHQTVPLAVTEESTKILTKVNS
jgi:hypothetical protein